MLAVAFRIIYGGGDMRGPGKVTMLLMDVRTKRRKLIRIFWMLTFIYAHMSVNNADFRPIYNCSGKGIDLFSFVSISP